jgi:hypothetical protein
MRHVAKRRPVEVAWKLFSLAVINHGNDYNAEAHNKGFRLERAMIAARRQGGNEAVEKLYMAFGNAQHGKREDLADANVIRGCLEEAGLPEDLFDQAMADPTTESDLLAEHEKAVEDMAAFGVPTIRLQGEGNKEMGWFGPIIDNVPTGEEAEKLFDYLMQSYQFSNMFEMKRTRRGGRLGPQPVVD